MSGQHVRKCPRCNFIDSECTCKNTRGTQTVRVTSRGTQTTRVITRETQTFPEQVSSFAVQPQVRYKLIFFIFYFYRTNSCLEKKKLEQFYEKNGDEVLIIIMLNANLP